MNRETTVAVVATRPETVLDDYARLLGLAGVVASIDAGEDRAWNLVPVMPTAPPGPAGACPPWQFEGVVRALMAAGQRPEDIAIVAPDPARLHQSPLADWRRVLRDCGVEDAPVKPTDPAAASARLLLANLRTHRRLGLVGTVAAQAAAVLPDRRPNDPLGPSEALERGWREHVGALAGAVVDATIAGDGRHGATLVPVAAHLILAGRDPVAVDAVASRLAGMDPQAVPLLAWLDRQGLGCADLAAIDLVGDVTMMTGSLDLVAARRFRSQPGDAGPRWWRRLSTAVDERWPRPLARRRARRRYENQAWGKLHAQYTQQGTIGGGRG